MILLFIIQPFRLCPCYVLNRGNGIKKDKIVSIDKIKDGIVKLMIKYKAFLFNFKIMCISEKELFVFEGKLLQSS